MGEPCGGVVGIDVNICLHVKKLQKECIFWTVSELYLKPTINIRYLGLLGQAVQCLSKMLHHKGNFLNLISMETCLYQ